MKTLAPKIEVCLVLFIAVYCAYDLAISVSQAWGFTTDDAYISWYYAKQFANGKGLLWDMGSSPVEGYSNFLWIMIAGAVIKLQLSLITTMKVISCLSLAAAVMVLYRLGRLFFSPLLAILPVFIFSHYEGVAWWSVSGFETSFYCLLVLVFIWQLCLSFGFHILPGGQTKALRSGYSTLSWAIAQLALLLLCLTRFEGVIWLLPMLVFIAAVWKPNMMDRPKLYRWVLISLVAFIVPYAVYFLWRLYYFGHLIPNTYACKGLVQGQFFRLDFDYLQVLSPLLVLSLPYFLSKKDARHFLLWLPSLLYVLMLWKADPVVAYYLRLFLAPFALFALLPVLGVREFLSYFNQLKVDPKILTAFIVVIVVLIFIPGNHAAAIKTAVTDYQNRMDMRMHLVQLLNKQAALGARVYLVDCGIIPFYARQDLRFIDAQCLNNSELQQAPYRHHLALYAEHLQHDMKPDWVVINYYPLEHHGDYLADLLRQKGFFDQYQLVTTMKSKSHLEDSTTTRLEIVDYVYEVYQRQ